jgi:hypothetical protein
MKKKYDEDNDEETPVKKSKRSSRRDSADSHDEYGSDFENEENSDKKVIEKTELRKSLIFSYQISITICTIKIKSFSHTFHKLC